jgi:hypothetical protein
VSCQAHVLAQEEADPTAWIALRLVFPHLWEAWAADLGGIEAVARDPRRMARFNAECFASLRHALDFRAKLPGLGLSLAQAVGIIEEALEDENGATDELEAPTGVEEAVDADRPSAPMRFARNRYPASEAMRAAVLNFWVRGLPEACIDYVLSLEAGTAARIVRQHPPHPGARKVAAAHFEGHPVSEVARRTGVPGSSVVRILGSIGEGGSGTLREDVRRRTATIRRLRDKEGLSYKEISRRLSVSMDTVRNATRRDRRRS